jgi:hypothetical protein
VHPKPTPGPALIRASASAGTARQPAIHFGNTRQADLPGGGINAILSRQADPAGRLGRQSCEIAR